MHVFRFIGFACVLVFVFGNVWISMVLFPGTFLGFLYFFGCDFWCFVTILSLNSGLLAICYGIDWFAFWCFLRNLSLLTSTFAQSPPSSDEDHLPSLPGREKREQLAEG